MECFAQYIDRYVWIGTKKLFIIFNDSFLPLDRANNKI